MGTIAEKIQYLDQTRELLKDNINKINNVLTDQSTFRSYPQELFNGYLDILNNGTDTLWNNLTKVSQTGTEAVLEGVETAPMKMVLNGNTSQETTTGKNLFNKDNEQKIVINPTTGTERYGIIIEAPNKKVSFSGTWLSDNNLTYKLINGETYGSYVSFNSPITIDVQDKILFYNGTENQKLSAIVDKIQIEIGTITSYEPYTGGQPSPSPDYPQEVKVVTGNNVVSVSVKNLFDKNNYNLFNGYVYSNKFVYAWQGYMVYIPCKSNTTYTISRIKLENNFVVSSSVDIPVANGQTTNSITKNTATSITYETGVNDKYLEVYVKYYGDSSYSFSEIIDSLQIEEGSTTPYVPYSKTDYPINLDPNLADLSTFENGYVSGTNGSNVGSSTRGEMMSPYIKVKPNTTYTFAIIKTEGTEISWFGIGYYTTNDTSGFIIRQISEKAGLNYYTFTTLENTEYIRVSARNLTTATKVQLVEGISTQELPLELCKINTYKDYFYKDSGKWYLHKAINKGIINLSRNGETLVNKKWFFFNKPNDSMDKGTYTTNAITEVAQIGISQSTLDVFFSGSGGITLYAIVYSNTTTSPTLEELQEKVNGKSYYYVLKTPTEEEITNTTLIEQLEAIYKAKSVKDKTYITQTNDELPFILDVEAIKEYSVE